MTIYRRPKFLEVLLEIREQMALEVDYDVDLFAETARAGRNVRVVSPRAVRRRGSLTPEDKTAELVPTRDD